MAAGNIVKENKVPAVGTSCTNPQVTANNDYYFRACFIDPFQGKVMAEYAHQNGFKKVAIVQEVSNDYSVGLAKFFREEFVKLTGDENSIVDIANYQTGDKDFTAILTNILHFPPRLTVKKQAPKKLKNSSTLTPKNITANLPL